MIPDEEGQAMSTRLADVTKRRRTGVHAIPPPLDESGAAIPRDEIERRAYARFVERGGVHGADLDDWLEAERELLATQTSES